MIDERQTTIEDFGAMPEPEVPVEGVFSGEVHPFASRFPMLSDEELEDLAGDIRENGLIHPIVLDRDGRLIDGRNRLEACRRAGVTGTFTVYHGQNPVAYILSENNKRRHMRKGQLVMLAVIAEPENLLNGSTSREVASDLGVHYSMVTMARTVRKWASDLVDPVILGTMELKPAYDVACKRRDELEGEPARLARLEKEWPDLALKVREGELTLPGAEAEAKERKRKEEQRIRITTENLNTALTYLDPGQVKPDEAAANFLDSNPDLVGGRADFSPERARRAADVLIRYAEMKEKQKDGRAT